MKILSKYYKYLSIIIIFIAFTLIFILNIKKIPEDNDDVVKNKIVLISHVYSNPYWQDVKKGAEDAAKEGNVIVEFQGPDYASSEEGIKLINIANAAKVSGIIAYVQEDDIYNSVINKVLEDGIPLITIDSDAEKSKRLCYVGTDNIAAGKLGAEELIKQIGETGQVGIVMGGKNVKNQIERVNGFTEYLKANSKIIIKQIESSDSYLLQAELAAKKILSENENIDALFCTSAQDGIGAGKAVKSMGLEGKVKIICFDYLPQTLEGIKNGLITSTVAQQPYEMGYEAVNTILNIIDGKKIQEIKLTGTYIINSTNIDDKIREQGVASENR